MEQNIIKEKGIKIYKGRLFRFLGSLLTFSIWGNLAIQITIKQFIEAITTKYNIVFLFTLWI